MPRLANPRHETFARARAAGLARLEAYRSAGYRGNGNVGKIDGHKEVKERIAELELNAQWGGSSDLGPVINALMGLAVKAGELGTAAGMTAARGLLAEAATLKGKLGALARSARPERPREILTDEEWLAKYGPSKTSPRT